MNEEQPMLAKITKGEWCKYRFWQEDLFVEFDYISERINGDVYLTEQMPSNRIKKATIKESSAKEFLRCFEIVKGEL